MGEIMPKLLHIEELVALYVEITSKISEALALAKTALYEIKAGKIERAIDTLDYAEEKLAEILGIRIPIG